MTSSLWRRHYCGALLVGLTLGLLSACQDNSPNLQTGEPPQRLSEWNLFSLADAHLTPVSDSLVFRPASTLFTDYAQKLRTLWIPEGKQIQLVDGELDYPEGSILSKTFYYPDAGAQRVGKHSDLREQRIDLNNARLIETRLLVKRRAGWDAYPYVWNSEESEAFLRIAGTSTPLTLVDGEAEQEFVYFVPNQNQCTGCHQTEHPRGDMHPLGARAAQLNSMIENRDGELVNQIAMFSERGWLTSAPDTASVAWSDVDAPLQDRAHAYLAINCGHCHNPKGAADTSALILDGSAMSPTQMGLCKPPVAAGGGAGNLRFGIVPGEPEQSIVLYRMRSQKPDEMMPELGRSLIHEEGIALVSNWIESLPGTCR